MRAFAPGSTAADVARGNPAVTCLRGALAAAPAAQPRESDLAPVFLREARALDVADETTTANLIGLFSQGFDATAGLVATTLTTLLGPQRQHLADARSRPAALADCIAEIARYDAPVQNTRRFAAADVAIMGSTMHAGDAVLVVLAAANRDRAANPRPHDFDPARTARASYTFGTGAHACPGQRIAFTIAGAAVRHLLAGGIGAGALHANGFRASLNARIPNFARPA